MRGFGWMLAPAFFAVLAGCAPVAVVGGGVASYLFAWGTVEEHVAVMPETMYRRAVEWAETYGEVEYAKDAKRRVKFKYYSSTIWIDVISLPNPKHSRVEIVARNKSMMTEESLARTIFKYLIPDERFILDKPRWYDKTPQPDPAETT